MTEDIVIVGGGISAQSAAIYAARADFEPVVLTGPQPGGQLTLTTDVENYLGFPDGVGGHELVQRGQEQAEEFGARFEQATVEAADFDRRPYELALSDGSSIRTQAVVLATGASARTLDIPGEDELMGYGLSSCATCDGAFHRGDDVLVVGGGDAAMEEALFLTKFAESVTVVHRRDELRSTGVLADQARDHDDIDFRWNTELVEVHGSQSDGLSDATVVSHPDGYPVRRREEGVDVETERLDVGGVFYAIGHEPNTEFLDGTGVELDDRGYVQTEAGTTATGVDGVFAAGDVTDSRYQQAVTAAGSGAKAALDAESYLRDRKEVAAAA